MNRLFQRVAAVWAFFAVAVLAGPSTAWAANSLLYAAEHISATPATPDLWRYDYVWSGVLHEGEVLELEFADGLYEALSAGAHPSELDSPLVIEPFGGSPGLVALTALAEVDKPAFSLAFSWLASTTSPGAQRWNLYDGGLTLVESGTTLPVPEPPALGLAVAGVVVLLLRKTTRHATRRRLSNAR